ncbi:uncharacterized protein YpiB (UPF0302 family) [Methanococcus voltae PS]|uniref:Uncharacterized protein YpiB (UPF0302 family) n=1 Tax=Methanococcus voltae PS TaxID=523842 RepID=A0ABT2EVJ8_METVO|nr:hypothetical protein [Methanococcus voltae]MCS3921983.1 uncharacterized protein YpiB (UPF0302 family) [Methanococcus voltae PS]
MNEEYERYGDEEEYIEDEEEYGNEPEDYGSQYASSSRVTEAIDLQDISNKDSLKIIMHEGNNYKNNPDLYLLGASTALSVTDEFSRKEMMMDLKINEFSNKDWGKPNILKSRKNSYNREHLRAVTNLNLTKSDKGRFADLTHIVQTMHHNNVNQVPKPRGFFSGLMRRG